MDITRPLAYIPRQAGTHQPDARGCYEADDEVKGYAGSWVYAVFGLGGE
jgi:hypothetical protein